MEYLNDMDDIYKNIEECNANKEHIIMKIFGNMITDMLNNKRLSYWTELATEVFITCRKLKISLVFITESYFAILKNIRLNSAHDFVMKISNKEELQQIAFNYSSDIEFKGFMNLYEKCTVKPNSFLVIDTLAPDNYVLERIF